MPLGNLDIFVCFKTTTASARKASVNRNGYCLAIPSVGILK